ncbi:MAG: PIN domain-containing protein [Methylococcaceae bacterium]|nr:PIN domain-containing protein [Methylococcaceae bacterium]
MQKFISKTANPLMKRGELRSTMKNKAYNLSNYTFIRDEVLLIDTNIWLYLFPAPSGPPSYLTRIYSAAFKNLLTRKATIAINSIILSEYLNRYCHIEYDALHKKKYATYKKFRQSIDYSSIGQRAAADAKEILKLCIKKTDDFTIADMPQILNGFESGSLDFNDAIIADACARHGWKLITHDGDFTEGGIAIITSNQKLLSNCATT